MRQDVRRFIEKELTIFQDTKRDYYLLKEEMCGTGKKDECYGRSNLPGAPTEEHAVRLIVSTPRISQLERVVSAIDGVMCNLDEDRFRLIQMRYWERPRTLTDDGIAISLCVSRSTMFRWLDEILMAIAERLGMIDEGRFKYVVKKR